MEREDPTSGISEEQGLKFLGLINEAIYECEFNSVQGLKALMLAIVAVIDKTSPSDEAKIYNAKLASKGILECLEHSSKKD